MVTTDFDVVVVGYGPIGQLLSLMLGKAGLRVAAVERYPSIFHMPRAVHFDHEIARIFQSAGIADEVQEIAEAMPPVFFEYRNAKREVLNRVRLGGDGPSGWAFAYGFAQQELETVLDAEVRKEPTVERFAGWQGVALDQSADEASLRIRPRDGGEERTLTARYVVGADGANSFVRSMMDTTVTDLDFVSDWLVVSVRYKSPDTPRAGLCQICDPSRSITVAPGGRNRQRFEFMLVGDETPEEMGDVAVTWRLLAEFGLNPDNVELERHSVYRFAARWADRWRDRRLLLAGDSAHVMPPFRAQGMCSGMRDAAALAWRLPLVLSGQAPDSLLDSYGPERIQHVVGLIHQTIEIGKMICISDPVEAAKRDAFMVAVAADPSLEPKRSALPQIAPGVTADGDPHACKLGMQGRVEVGGKVGRFDDVVGGGFALVGTTIDPAAHLSPENRAWFEQLGGVIAQVTPDGPIRDVDGAYGQFYDAMGVGAILTRPDFNIFGAAVEPGRIDDLVAELRAKLGMREVEPAS